MAIGGAAVHRVVSRPQNVAFSDGSDEQNAGDGNKSRGYQICDIPGGVQPGYRATLKTLSSFLLNAAISCPILSLVILA